MLWISLTRWRYQPWVTISCSCKVLYFYFLIHRLGSWNVYSQSWVCTTKMYKFCWAAIIVRVTVLMYNTNRWIVLNSACCFSTTEIAFYQEVIFPFTKISARPVWRKKGKRYSCPCACSKVEYEGGGKLHSFLNLALDGEVSGYLNTLVATPPAKHRLVLTGWVPEPAWTTQNVRLLTIQVFWDNNNNNNNNNNNVYWLQVGRHPVAVVI